MSNHSIILRLEHRFNDFVQGKIDPIQLGDYIENSINALEGVNPNIALKARDFSNRLEEYMFFPEESLKNIIADIETWLTAIKLDMKIK